MLADRIEALRADKGYDADPVREELASAGVEAVISGKNNRRVPSHTIARNIAGNFVESLW
jgi:IS5 family transposase